jgi:type II secretory pathway component PulF
MGSAAGLLWGVFFSSLGLGYFMYGKKQKAAVPFACGVALMLYPYFVTNTIMLVVVGVTLAVIPYFVKL